MSAVAEPPKLKPPPKGKRLLDGFYIPAVWRDDHFYLYKFGLSKGEEKLKWFKKLVAAYWPDPVFVWDRWATLYFGALCGAKQTVEDVAGVTIEVDYPWWEQFTSTGAASTGKSLRAAMWVLCNWLCAQEHTTCMLTSTSVPALKQRIWSELIDFIAKCSVPLPLEIIASDTVIRWNDKDTKSAIFGRAVDQGGSVDNAVGRIKGIHNRRVFVITDELTAMPEAIAMACRNLDSGTKEFQFIGLGNATDYSDQHGIYCEPMDGWNSIGPDAEFWLTKLGGCCVHLDGHRSPALEDPERFHFYIGKKKLDKDARFFGGVNTPEYWREDRGFWAPTGLSTKVMDAALFNQFHVSDKAVWKAGWEVGAFLDPSFEGGDRRVLQPFRWGVFANGITGIEYQSPIIVSVDMKQDVRWIHYQISDAVQAHCEQYQIDGKPAPILPRNFLSDTSGEGGGLFSVMSGRWSPEIQSLEFGGAAEKIQISPDRPTTYHELYANKVTMLHYVLRRFIEGDQVRGLIDHETRQELTSREKKMKNGRTMVLPKSEMKGMKHNSPDKGDAAVGAAEFLRRKGVMPAGSTGGAVLLDPTAWNAFADRTNLADEEGDYGSEESSFVG